MSKKKVWTPAMRKAFALKMKRARAAKGTRRRRKNPTKAQVKAAAGRIAKKAAALAWAGTKRTARFTGRVAGAGAKAAAAEVKASICRPRAKNPKNKGFEVRMGSKKKRKLVWTSQTRADAIYIARVFAKANPHKVVSVHAEK
jgi:hypothetical protein